MNEATAILDAIGKGDAEAPAAFLNLVYNELRHLATSKMAREAPGQTLQATALVHEAWLRLTGAIWRKICWQAPRETSNCWRSMTPSKSSNLNIRFMPELWRCATSPGWAMKR